MDLEFDFLAAQGLSRYVRLVAEELGLTGDCSFVQLAPPVNAYLAVDGRLRAQLVSYARLDTVQAYPVIPSRTSAGGHL
jgi:hypothetical protein